MFQHKYQGVKKVIFVTNCLPTYIDAFLSTLVLPNLHWYYSSVSQLKLINWCLQPILVPSNIDLHWCLPRYISSFQSKTLLLSNLQLCLNLYWCIGTFQYTLVPANLNRYLPTYIDTSQPTLVPSNIHWYLSTCHDVSQCTLMHWCLSTYISTFLYTGASKPTLVSSDLHWCVPTYIGVSQPTLVPLKLHW